MIVLTDAEREALRAACGFVRNRNVETVVESVVAAREQAARERVLAQVEALDSGHNAYCTFPDERCICVIDLMALRALVASVREGAER